MEYLKMKKRMLLGLVLMGFSLNEVNAQIVYLELDNSACEKTYKESEDCEKKCLLTYGECYKGVAIMPLRPKGENRCFCLVDDCFFKVK